MNDKVTNFTYEYNGSTKDLEPRADMIENRSDFTIVYVQETDRIYVLGGNNMQKFYAACEYYDVAKDTWNVICPMRVARDSAAAALI